MRRYALELIVFLSGAVVMILEIVGTRLIAPYFGTSLPVWTAIISIVLASLSVGYYYGGKLADKGATEERLGLIVAAAGVLVGLTMFFQNVFLATLGDMQLPLVMSALIAVTILLGPAALMLGIISPYAARLKIVSVDTSGAAVGRLSALATAGSIVGTGLAGFVLLRFFGSTTLLSMLAVALLLISLLAYRHRYFVIGVLIIALVCIIGRGYVSLTFTADVDTAYNRIWIFDKDNVRTLSVGGVSESAMYLDGNPDPVFPYTRFYRLAQHFAPDAKRALMLGGAGYSSPRDFLKRTPGATIDVVEIDPGMTQVARDYFNLGDDPRLRIIHEDGRVYINQTDERYDVFFGDAFGSFFSVPYQLTTLEAAERVHALLADKGVAILNLIGSLEGEKGRFIRAEYRTYGTIFPHVYLLPVNSTDPLAIQNVILVALKGDEVSLSSHDSELDSYLQKRWMGEVAQDVPVLTDDFAPVDQYISSLLGK